MSAPASYDSRSAGSRPHTENGCLILYTDLFLHFPSELGKRNSALSQRRPLPDRLLGEEALILILRRTPFMRNQRPCSFQQIGKFRTPLRLAYERLTRRIDVLAADLHQIIATACARIRRS